MPKSRSRLIFPPSQADSTSSYLPVYFTNLDITVKDLTTSKQIAHGNWRNQKLKRGTAEFVSLPVQFSYTGVNTSDTTCECSVTPVSLPVSLTLVHSGSNMYNACGHLWTGTTRQGRPAVGGPSATTDIRCRYSDRGDAAHAHQGTSHSASLVAIDNGYRLPIPTSVQ